MGNPYYSSPLILVRFILLIIYLELLFSCRAAVNPTSGVIGDEPGQSSGWAPQPPYGWGGPPSG